MGKLIKGGIDILRGKSASQGAIRDQTQAMNDANAILKDTYNTQLEGYRPWQQAGMRALAGLEDPNFMKNFTGDPGYQFRLQEGNNAINASAAARGMGNSGATMKALARYGQDFASNEYNNAYNRAFGRLSTIAGYGQNANQGISNAAQNYGSSVSNNFLGLGDAKASARIAQANRDSQLLQQGIQGGMALFSDRNVKTNITPIDKNDLQEMKSHLKAYAFNYLNDEHGEGDWVGVMAQDLEKTKLGRTLVFEDAHGHKQIDIKKTLSLFLATMAEGA